MIKEYAANIADQMGIHLTSVSAIECHSSINQEVFLVILAADNRTVKTLLYQSDFEELLNTSETSPLNMKISSALLELKSTCNGHPLLPLY